MISKNHKIVLTSYYAQPMDWLTDYLHNNNVVKIAYIMDAVTPRLRREPSYVFKNIKMLEDRGFEVDFIKLEGTDNIRERLSEAQAVYVTGGDTFYLLNEIRKSGFDIAIKDLLDKGVIYIGESAGSYVACPTIEMAHWKHQNADTVGLDSLEALSLVPYLVSVHYKDEFKKVIESAVEKTTYEVKILTDYQLILREDGKDRLIDL